MGETGLELVEFLQVFIAVSNFIYIWFCLLLQRVNFIFGVSSRKNPLQQITTQNNLVFKEKIDALVGPLLT